MPNGHHNDIKAGDRPQSPTTIERCCQHRSGNAGETIETPTSSLEQVIFNKDITEEEFSTFTTIASTNTAPSPTGLTLNMIKKWPEEVKKTIFTALCKLWSTKNVPTQWKWKWLCQNPKIDSGIPKPTLYQHSA